MIVVIDSVSVPNITIQLVANHYEFVCLGRFVYCRVHIRVEVFLYVVLVGHTWSMLELSVDMCLGVGVRSLVVLLYFLVIPLTC